MKKSEKIVTKNPLVILLWILGLILPVLLFLKFYEFYSGAWVPMFIPKPWYVADKIVIYKAWVLSLIWGTITLLFFVKTLKTVWKKSLKNASLTFLLWIITYLSIFVVAPSYTFQNYPRVFMYMDAKGEYIKYPSYYFWLVEKMGFYWQTYKPLKTLDDSILWLELSSYQKNESLYIKIVEDMNRFWYENVIEKYDNKIFIELLLLNTLAVWFWKWEYNHEIEDWEKFFSRIQLFRKILTISNDKKVQETLNAIIKRYDRFLKDNENKEDFFKDIKEIYQEYYNSFNWSING